MWLWNANASALVSAQAISTTNSRARSSFEMLDERRFLTVPRGGVAAVPFSAR
jgi:hypothetical protein